ncbi:MAG: Na+/H+ antiporter NhaA, partial [Roseiflexaceae bacterium]|nr:Na+/H+ antiporter NhaA [Roseiflexaceae bacterium]
MVIFFFLVGLEIKRELLVGELSNTRAALLPIAAAAGGATVPALLYLGLNFGGVGSDGWAIPMATDIAFALGVLSLLGSRVPFGLKVFLTAVAIVDDLIAVLMIALFYAGELNSWALSIGLVVLALLALANLVGLRSPLIYGALGVVVWLAFLESGVHATIAGVLVALTVPARSRLDPAAFLDQSRRLLDEFAESSLEPNRMLTEERQQAIVIELEDLSEGVQAPLQKMEHTLHPWVFFLIMPIFALANAGVAISSNAFSGGALPVVLGVVLGLVVGKPLGLLLASWLVVRAGLATLPAGVSWVQLAGAGLLAGIGFTMSLFITSLAFGALPEVLAAAKIGILLASVVAGALGLACLNRAGREQTPVNGSPALQDVS